MATLRISGCQRPPSKNDMTAPAWHNVPTRGCKRAAVRPPVRAGVRVLATRYVRATRTLLLHWLCTGITRFEHVQHLDTTNSLRSTQRTNPTWSWDSATPEAHAQSLDRLLAEQLCRAQRPCGPSLATGEKS